jgi:alanine or glycine:cation symporter, AGCS family
MKGIPMTLESVVGALMGWPLIIIAVAISVLCTVVFKFVQVRYFVAAWKYFLTPTEKSASADMSPVQALINALNSNLGNGTIAGVATALCAGGPGAVLWILIIGLLLMSVRFAEVFLSTYFAANAPAGTKVGGPMLYLGAVFGGKILPYLYAFICLLYGLVVANAMQVNSITISLQTIAKPYIAENLFSYLVGLILFAFVVYIMVGGSERIVKASEKIVPLKVGLFCLSTIIILIYYWASILPALKLICTSAFHPLSIAGGILGFTVQQAMRFGISRAVMATEAGLGTTAIMFGATGSKEPVKDAIMSMLGTFITTIIAFTMGLCIVVSGVWNNGLNSTALTMSAFETVFGSLGGLIVIFLAVSFGLGVVVAYAYVARETWIFLTKGSFLNIFAAIYCLVTFLGCVADVNLVWLLAEIFNGLMLVINLYGIVYLLPVIRKGLSDYMSRQR